VSGVEDRSGVDDTLEVRVRAAFTDLAVDDEARERVLASVYRRVRPAGGLQSMRASAVRISIMFVVMAAILATLFVRGSRLPVDLPIRQASAAEILGNALAAVSDSSTVLHVIATTDTSETPAPDWASMSFTSSFGHPSVLRDEATPTAKADSAPSIRRPRTTPIDRTDAEHWIDRTRNRVRSNTARRTRDMAGQWRTDRLDQLVANGRQQKVQSVDGGGMRSEPDFFERSVADTETGIPELGDPGVQEPSLQLRDTSDPHVYLALLKGRPLNAPPDVNGEPMVTRTSAQLLKTGSIDSSSTYTLRVVSSSYWQISKGVGTNTTLTVTVRASDYLPIRVEGVQRGYETDSAGRKSETEGMTTWTTVYTVMETLRADQVPSDAFRLKLPSGTVKRSNTPWPAEKIASAVDFPVTWLSARYKKMRFTGTFRRTENMPDSTSHANPENATVEADQSRPTISPLQVVAEYSPSGKPAAHDKKQTTPGIKVISMPRTDPSGWERAFRTAQGNMFGDTSPAEIAWTTVKGRRALHLRHEWRWGNGTPKGHVTMSVEYLVIDLGESTVLIQGAGTSRGQVEKAAGALRQVR
jgi:hypothetical protein